MIDCSSRNDSNLGRKHPFPRKSLITRRRYRMIRRLIILGLLHAGYPLTLFAQSGTIRWEQNSRASLSVKAPIELDNGHLLGSYSNPVEGGGGIICSQSVDGGQTWQRFSVIARDSSPTVDIGDGDFAILPNGHILHSYRHNLYRNLPLAKHEYSIKVAISKDRGKTWEYHSTVARSRGTKYGFWASFITQISTGQLQCYYDDEVTPAKQGVPRHQWAQMKTWNPRTSRWGSMVTVSRTRRRDHLARDGMCSVVELPNGRLICAMESCTARPPFTGLTGIVTSDDGGKTWSWTKGERPILYQPKKRRFNALAPWITRLSNGKLICVFVTDEGRSKPDKISTGRRDQDLKFVLSSNGGRTWSKRATLLERHPIYLPGVTELKHGPFERTIVCCFANEKTGLYVKRRVLP